MPLFSERYGYKHARDVAQLESMDKPLRNGLWNCIRDELLRIRGKKSQYLTLTPLVNYGEKLWHDFFRLPADEMPRTDGTFFADLKARFMASAWNEVYDLVEYMAISIPWPEKFMASADQVLRRELSGYAFVGNRLAPIVDDSEIAEIGSAAKASSRPVAQHLATAIDLLSNRTEPNYRKSVSESISAVEAAVRELSGKPKAPLSDGLKALGIDLHPALKQAFEKVYGYTSDEGGIRHALTQDSREIDLSDARYMLIVCSAFVNYLRSKAKRELA